VLAEWELRLADRERDLEGHRAALRDVRADLAGHRAALESVQGESVAQRRTIATLAADLDGHRAALANLERDIAGERAGRAAAEQALQHSDAELRRMLQLASGLENSLAQRELVYDQLRRELRSRWRNFVRVFRPLR
jgi:chromosome segregation ATPase